VAFDELIGRIGSRFSRVEPRRRARSFLLGLMAGLARTNCWTIAERAGDATPDGMQHLLARAVWDHDGVRDDLRGYVVDHLGEDDAVLVVDETGDLKKGTATVGVQRQYTGTAGRIENAQVGVYLVYATARGHAFIDRELYLPRSWTDDRERCRSAGVGDDVDFATKPALAAAMIARALDAGVPASWVTGDEVYGNDPALREMLHSRQIGYVLAIAANHRLDAGFGRREARDLIGSLPPQVWSTHSAADGAKGRRYYAWALIDLAEPGNLLIRRNLRTGELAFYRTWSPAPHPLATLATVAGRRWTIEESFQTGKGLTALDEHQVRTWTSWRRWTILAMLAHAFLTVTAATEPRPEGPSLTRITLNELRHLFTALLNRPPHDQPHLLRWSQWRRRHQMRARACHYHRQSTQLS
jgi:SRSO17 transposase